MATRKEIQHNAEFEKSAFCFELARWLCERRDRHRHNAPANPRPDQPQRDHITLKPGELLETLREFAPHNAAKFPATSKALFRAFRDLAPAFATRGIVATRTHLHGHRRWRLDFPPEKIYPSANCYPPPDTEKITFRIHTGTNAHARETGQQSTGAPSGSNHTGKQKKRLVEDCFRGLTAREAAHVPNIETTTTPITGTNASTPFVVCPKCRERRRKLYKPTPRDRWLCRRCHELTFRSSQEHATNHSFAAALWTTGDPVQERYKELFYPAYGEAADKHIAAGKPRYELDYLANRIGKDIREKLKAEWLAEQRRAKNPRAK